MPKLQDIEAVKEKIENLRTKKDRAEGALEHTLQVLQDEFECDSLEAAEALLKNLEAKEAKAESKRDKAFTEFMDKWGETLEL